MEALGPGPTVAHAACHARRDTPSMNLHMLVLGEGRERTVDEYATPGAHAP